MLILFETPAGYAVFKLLDELKLSKVDNLYDDFETPEKASKVVKLKHFKKFADTTEALAATTAAIEGKLPKTLKKFLQGLKNDDIQEQLLVADTKLGNAIKDKLNFPCVSNNAVQELMRCMRSQLDSLLTGLPKKEMTAMALGLAHSLSRYKLKFSPDKIDTMIVQAQCLLDDLDKELNNYIMRCREWYGWHFPELGKLIADNITYVKTVKLIGTRDYAIKTDLSDILAEEDEEKVKEAAEVSMGTEISEDDIINIQNLCTEILSMNEYRAHLSDYLKARMMAMAPNLSVLIGEHIGARLIAKAGSLMNLAKHPASTIQILGAEKALFRALKTRKQTPKYGLIYHAQLIGQSSTKNKGKMSRMLAAKASLATRVDAFGEDVKFDLGVEHKVKLEAKLKLLEEGNFRSISGSGKAKAKFEKYHGVSEVKHYPAAADSTIPKKEKRSHVDEPEDSKEAEETIPKKKKKVKSEKSTELDVTMESEIKLETTEVKVKKEKKKKSEVFESEKAQEDVELESSAKKKKKKSKKHSDE